MYHNVFINSVSEGVGCGTLMKKDIERVEVKHDTIDGKDLVTVEINGELIFSYDANFKGQYYMRNHIQTPLEGK
ncbi:hypothetical protein [Bacillus phage vB_BanS-Thrax3]|nr:hypothetical protein [Bacillus phage vB_BanS-Thrax1]UUV46586.1 hypothetical protein [Bacillus phage vB_BanS-Thrax3]